MGLIRQNPGWVLIKASSEELASQVLQPKGSFTLSQAIAMSAIQLARQKGLQIDNKVGVVLVHLSGEYVVGVPKNGKGDIEQFYLSANELLAKSDDM